MRLPVLTVPERKLSYQFMAAEAYWILSGDNRVDGISPWNKRIADFSDDGSTFFGAYGPKISDQLDYVIRKLAEDPDTRQAGLMIWREKPPQTKDVPCTIAIFASIRNDRLNLSVYMRSSDVWLGLPYDVFNFSMLAHLICCRLSSQKNIHVSPGTLYLTAASSHLYEDQWAQAEALVQMPNVDRQNPTPEILFKEEEALMRALEVLRETKAGDACRWWEHKNAA
jgi:thymidylate synthase